MLTPAYNRGSSEGGTGTLTEPPGVSVRRAAVFPGTASGTVIGTTFPMPSGSYSMVGTFVIESTLASPQILGRQGSGAFNLRALPDGKLQLRTNSTQLFVSAEPLVPLDRTVQRLGFEVVASGGIATEVYGLVDGSRAFGGPITPTSLAVGNSTHNIGAVSTGGGNFKGSVWDVDWIVEGDDSNTAVFPLDTRDASGNFPNTHPGSTVADATVTGFIGEALVNTTEAAESVAVGREVLLHSGSRTDSAVLGSGLTNLTLSAIALNESDGFALNDGDIFTVPVDGVLVARGVVALSANAQAASSGTLEIRDVATVLGSTTFEAGARDAGTESVYCVAPVSAGSRVRLITDITATTLSRTRVDFMAYLYPEAP